MAVTLRGFAEANIDGAFDVNSRKGGIGVVVKDSTGDVVGGVCMHVVVASSPVEIEAKAARAACKLVVQFQLAPISFEGDFLQVIQAVNAREKDTSPWVD